MTHQTLVERLRDVIESLERQQKLRPWMLSVMREAADALTGQEGAAPSPRARCLQSCASRRREPMACDCRVPEGTEPTGEGYDAELALQRKEDARARDLLRRQAKAGEVAAQEPQTVCNCTVHRHCPRCHGIQMEPGYGCLDCGFKGD